MNHPNFDPSEFESVDEFENVLTNYDDCYLDGFSETCLTLDDVLEFESLFEEDINY